MRLPAEARDGLSRAWLEILKERHPGVSWVLATNDANDLEQTEPLTAEEQLAVVA